jgi:hypothetical protein
MLQRFGSGSIATHSVGAALLRGEWKAAASLILDPREGDILPYTLSASYSAHLSMIKCLCANYVLVFHDSSLT